MPSPSNPKLAAKKSRAFAELASQALAARKSQGERVNDRRVAFRVALCLNRGLPWEQWRSYDGSQVRRVLNAKNVWNSDDHEILEAWIETVGLDRVAAYAATSLMPPEVDEAMLRRYEQGRHHDGSLARTR